MQITSQVQHISIPTKLLKHNSKLLVFIFLNLQLGYVLHAFICLFLALHYRIRRSWAQWIDITTTTTITTTILKGNWIHTHNIDAVTKDSVVTTSAKYSIVIKNVNKGEENRYLLQF